MQVREAFKGTYPQIEDYIIKLIQPKVPVKKQWIEETKADIAGSLKNKLLKKLENIRSHINRKQAVQLAEKEVYRLGAVVDIGFFAADLYNKYSIWKTCKPSVDNTIDSIKRIKKKEESLRKSKISWILAFNIFIGEADFTEIKEDEKKTKESKYEKDEVSGKEGNGDSMHDEDVSGEYLDDEKEINTGKKAVYWKLTGVKDKEPYDPPNNEYLTLESSVSRGSIHFNSRAVTQDPDNPERITKMNFSWTEPPNKLNGNELLTINGNYTYSCKPYSEVACGNYSAITYITYQFDKENVKFLNNGTKLGQGDMHTGKWTPYPQTIHEGSEGDVMAILVWCSDLSNYSYAYYYIYEWIE